MNNDALNADARGGEHRYDPQTPDSRAMALEPDTKEKPPRTGSTHAAKLASLSILFAVVVVFGSLAIVSNRRPETKTTQASSESLYGPASVSTADKALTSSVTEYPKAYKDRPIPENIVTEGERKYVGSAPAERKAYIINRIILFYIYEDVLTTNNIAHTKTISPLTFDAVESALPELSSVMKREYPQSEVFVQQYLPRFTY